MVENDESVMINSVYTMKEIPVFFTFDRYYVLAACVAFYSLLKNSSNRYYYKFYVLHTDLKERDKLRLYKVVSRFFNASLDFKDVSCYNVDGWNQLLNKSHFSKEIFYKLIAADIFPSYNRILFSDVDVVFVNDISSSFFMYLDEDFYFAGTRPILKNEGLYKYDNLFTPEEIDIIDNYEISAGYMLINLSCIRRDNKQKELMDFFWKNTHRLVLPEQDCIALCCTSGIRFLPYKYVVCAFQYYIPLSQLNFNTNNIELKDRQRACECYLEMLNNVVQLHYPGVNKPWNNPTVYRYKEWFVYCVKSRQVLFYLLMQPIFFLQRVKRYSLRRFLSKLK